MVKIASQTEKHQHGRKRTGSAKAALRCVHLCKSLLDWMEIFNVSDSLYCNHCSAINSCQRKKAGIDRRMTVNRTGTMRWCGVKVRYGGISVRTWLSGRGGPNGSPSRCSRRSHLRRRLISLQSVKSLQPV
jgi:hypothetical protein